MSTITRSITIDVSTARHLREKADRFKEAADAETRPKVAARFYKQVAFLEGEAEFYEARAQRMLDLYAAPSVAGFRDYVTISMEEQNDLKTYVERVIPVVPTIIGQGSNGIGVILDQTLAASQARISLGVRRILTNILKEALVAVFQEYFYRIDFGPDVYPQFHIVSHDLYCTCVLEADCPAGTAVKVYLLRKRGEPAKQPDPGYFPAAPHFCPICGVRACYDPELSSHHRGIGWQCSKHGRAHYWQHQAKSFRVAIPSKSVSL